MVGIFRLSPPLMPLPLPQACGLMQSFRSELEQDDPGLYLQQNSHSNLTTAFAGAHPHGGNVSSMDNGSFLRTQSANGAASSSYFNNALDHGISFNMPNSLPSLVSLEAKGNRSSVGEYGISPSQNKFEFRGRPSLLPHSVPEYHDVLFNTVSSSSPGGMSSTINIGQSERKMRVIQMEMVAASLFDVRLKLMMKTF